MTNHDKRNFYKKIDDALNNSGAFYNLDVTLGSNDFIQEVYMKKWISFMQTHCDEKEIRETWLPKYDDEDFPASLMRQLAWLNQIGLKISISS